MDPFLWAVAGLCCCCCWSFYNSSKSCNNRSIAPCHKTLLAIIDPKEKETHEYKKFQCHEQHQPRLMQFDNWRANHSCNFVLAVYALKDQQSIWSQGTCLPSSCTSMLLAFVWLIASEASHVYSIPK